jgi:hypothetical protein
MTKCLNINDIPKMPTKCGNEPVNHKYSINTDNGLLYQDGAIFGRIVKYNAKSVEAITMENKRITCKINTQLPSTFNLKD